MPATPLVSVMVITYNHDRYVEQTLDMILAQRVDFPWEVVVADDCSTDTTPAILARYQQQYPDIVRVLPTEHNLGVSRNFERAMLACQGKFVAVVEGDDYWTSVDKLQLQADFLQTHPDFSMCFHNAEVVYEDDPTRTSHLMNRQEKPEYTLDDITSGWFIATASVMYRNGVLQALPTWVHESVVVDLPLFSMLAAKGRVGYLPQTMSVYRVHGGGVTRAGKQEQFLLRLGKMCQYLDEELQFKYHRNLTLKQSENYSVLAGVMAKAHEYGKARQYFLRSLRGKLAAGKLPTVQDAKSLLTLLFPALRREAA